MKKHALLILFGSISFAWQVHGMNNHFELPKVTAFLMAAHPRLGAQSLAHVLPPELRQQIAELVETSEVKALRLMPQETRDDKLNTAVRHGEADRIRILLAAGADVNAENRWNETVLCLAVNQGYLPVVSVLLAAGADSNLTFGGNRDTPLHYAIEKQNLPIMRALLAAPGINVNARTRIGHTPLFNLTSRLWENDLSLAMVQELLDAGAAPYIKCPYGYGDSLLTPLQLAIIHRLTRTIALLHAHMHNMHWWDRIKHSLWIGII